MVNMKIYGVIGWPIKHSLSPAMHNAAFRKLGIDAKYELFEVPPEKLEDFILNRKDVVGFNITVPHKIRAKEILEKKYEVPVKKQEYIVKLTGAVNTVKRTINTLEYYNTDVLGFQTALKEDLKFNANGKTVLLVGCGGAGRAVIAALCRWESIEVKKLYIYEINKGQVDSTKKHFSNLSNELQDILKEKIEFISEDKIQSIIKKCQLLVNASPIGMKEGDNSPIDIGLLHKDLFVYDVVYNRETELVKAAKPRSSGGLSMLLYQGVHAFEFWTDKKAPVDVMREALNKALTTNH